MLGAMITEEKTILFSLPQNKSEYVDRAHIINNQMGWIINDDTTYSYIEKMPVSRYFVGDHSLEEGDTCFDLPIEEIDRHSVRELFGLIQEEQKVMSFSPMIKQ